MKQFLLLCLALLTSGYGLAQYNTLTVADVRQSWYTQPGTIETATLSLHPKGIYVECGLYLTFSAQGAYFYTDGDSLEVVLDFTLPEGSILHDSWLWVGDDIVKAHIFDRWTASTIYEGIVNRRQDPSILVKNSTTQYQLRVFPMAANSTRKVKITWLQPAAFFHNRTELALPFDLVNTSYNTVPEFNLLVWSDDRFQTPALTDRPDLGFETVIDSVGSEFFRLSLTPDLYTNELRLQFASPLQDGYYLGTFSEGDEEFYQLAVLPQHFLPAAERRKVALLFDYEADAYAPTIAALLAAGKSALLNNLTPTDSFNLFFSNLIITKAADRWLPAHPDTIQQVFAALNNPLSPYSNLQPLLLAGIQWIQQQGGPGDILLLSNSSQFASFQAANSLINDLLDILDPPVAINVVDFNEKYYPSYYLNNQYYYANGYFLNNLAILSGGAYTKTFQTQTLSKALQFGFDNLGSNVETFELYTSVNDGFCYGRFNVGASSNATNLYRPVLQVGKFTGEPPFQFEINGFTLNQPWHVEVEVPAPDILNTDTLLREMWYGRFVEALEAEPQANTTIGNIIFHSLAERVLSQYTAFLCLENLDWICDDCEDETQYTGTDQLSARDSVLTAFPNPFADHTTVVIQGAGSGTGRASFEIYDIHGRLVRRFDLAASGDETRIEWDGADLSGQEVPAGAYLGLLKQGGQTRVLKLVKMQR